MKKTFLKLMAFFATAVPLALPAQNYTQSIPDHINEIRVEDNARIVVTEGSGATIAATADAQVATVNGNRLIISDNASAAITLPAGRSISFVADDRSQITFNGSFGKRDKLSVVSNDYAKVSFSGSLADSLWAVDLNLRADDYSNIKSDIRLASFHYKFAANDHAIIHLACQQDKPEPGPVPSVQSLFKEDNAHLTVYHCIGDSIVGMRGEHDLSVTEGSGVSGANHTKRPIRHRRTPSLDFAWGLHNWGDSPLNGFSGIDGTASIRTSFNHIHLSLNYPLISTRRFGTYLGLGLDWNKYKFDASEIYFNTDAAAFVDSGDAHCSSRMLTRYLVVPLTLRFDLGHSRKWTLSIAALPGIHWSGSHTGIRRQYEDDLRDVLQKDPSVNKFINPYKLDLRASLTYSGIGIYLQAPTMSTMRSSVQELYPIKFGLYFSFD